ncbi:MAG: 4Fe-4S binding protein [Blautia sp.]|nr:4Fe-4S binding protein [Blautia sp.]
MRTDISKLHGSVSWKDITDGQYICNPGCSVDFLTGEWRVDTPQFIVEKCKQCLLCVPVCPDSCIAVVDGKRTDFDLDHCKGCGICAEACKFEAIIMKKGEK